MSKRENAHRKVVARKPLSPKSRKNFRTSKLESSRRWKTFLGKDESFRDFVEHPLSRMVDNFSRMQRRIAFLNWKDETLLGGTATRNPYMSQGGQFYEGNQIMPGEFSPEYAWEDASFDPYEVDENDVDDQAPDDASVSTSGEVFYAGDGQALDVDDLRAPFLGDISNDQSDVSHEQSANVEEKHFEDNVSSQASLLTSNVYPPLTSQMSHSQADVLSLHHQRSFVSTDSNLNEFPKFEANQAKLITTPGISSFNTLGGTSSQQRVILSAHAFLATSTSNRPPMSNFASTQSVETRPIIPSQLPNYVAVRETESSYYDDSTGEGFELPP